MPRIISKAVELRMGMQRDDQGGKYEKKSEPFHVSQLYVSGCNFLSGRQKAKIGKISITFP